MTSGRWKGYLPFAIAFDLYSDLVFTGSHERVTMKQQKYQFRTDILHPEYGLCIYIFKHNEKELVILQNDQVELSGVLNEIAGHQEMVPDEINHAPSFELVQGLLGTLDSEWSRLAVRGLLSSMLSGKQLYNIGINPTTGNASLCRLKYVIEESSNAKLAAKDIARLKIKESIRHLTDKEQELQKALQNPLLSDVNNKRIEEELSAVQKRYRQKLSYNQMKIHWHLCP
ncbi:unnamed protein product [Porites lobata]|uniref:Uncharacterized protein n=1 Tax=Porites lobata TaxID=104759 RepID=A0ABN8QM17_9CNID|nr:unnamed protein product [Porites lobata]